MQMVIGAAQLTMQKRTYDKLTDNTALLAKVESLGGLEAISRDPAKSDELATALKLQVQEVQDELVHHFEEVTLITLITLTLTDRDPHCGFVRHVRLVS